MEYTICGQDLVGYQEILFHMIFDIKMDGGFTHKARYVAGDHTTNPPSSIMYSSIVYKVHQKVTMKWKRK